MHDADGLNVFLIAGLILFALAALGAAIHLLIRRGVKRRRFEETMKPLPFSLKPIHRDVLVNRFPFYKGLSEQQRNRFDRRLMEVMKRKRIELPGVSDPHDIAALVVCASQVQITLGLAIYTFPRFRRIIVMPDRFKSSKTGMVERGEVSTEGVIILSWKHLAEGISNPADGYALGLHEMAHALYLENFTRDSEYHFFSSEDLEQWRETATETLKEIRHQKQSFLRAYAGTNIDELFAVGVEYFFEKPLEFSLAHPQLYQALSRLLNLDPRNASEPVVDVQVILDYDPPEERSFSEKPLRGISSI